MSIAEGVFTAAGLGECPLLVRDWRRRLPVIFFRLLVCHAVVWFVLRILYVVFTRLLEQLKSPALRGWTLKDGCSVSSRQFSAVHKPFIVDGFEGDFLFHCCCV
jgi:hypothetical protein